jgi:hypothetical protein
LDKRFPGWKFPSVDPEIQQLLRKKDAVPYFIEGDFDGNGEMDCAVYITFDRPPEKTNLVVALLKKGEIFEVFVVDSVSFSSPPGQEQYPSIEYLETAKKGSEGLDHETGENFKYATDSIIQCFFEKASVSFVFENGKFRRIITAD